MKQRRIDEAVAYLSDRLEKAPDIGLITGTGLGDLTEKISVDLRLPYDGIPHFPASTVEGHKGSLVAGRLEGRAVLAMEGRFHLYEGYTYQEITFPLRVMSSLGVRTLFISSAAGGLDPHFSAGDLMVVTDHINLTGGNPLAGPNLERYGPRFPDMSEAYARDLIALARERALAKGILLREGVYAGITGPSLETPAETRFLRMIGASAVGMSTVSEVIVGIHCGMKVLAIMAVTNVNLPDCMKPTSLEEVIERAREAGKDLSLLWADIARHLPD